MATCRFTLHFSQIHKLATAKLKLWPNGIKARSGWRFSLDSYLLGGYATQVVGRIRTDVNIRFSSTGLRGHGGYPDSFHFQKFFRISRCSQGLARYDEFPMFELGITAIVVGPILLALVLIPGLAPVMLRGWQTLGIRISPRRAPNHSIPTHLTLSGDVWLLAGGGVMLILGLFVLLYK